MPNTSFPRTLIVAALMAAAGAVAQAAETSDAPQSAGEYSTMTHGVPNALLTGRIDGPQRRAPLPDREAPAAE